MEDIKKKLQSYPSSFDVGDIVRSFSNKQKESIRSKLLHELNSSVDEFSTSMEKVRVLNLLSYLCFIFGDKENAIDYNRKALETNQCSVIALSNKGWFSLEERKNFRTCDKVCQQLKDLQKDRMANLIAKAEIAFTYTRLGLKHYEKAVQEFKEVIAEIEKGNLKDKVVLSTSKGDNNDSKVGGNNDSEYVAEYYCVWIYGCALSLRRLCHVNNMHDICEIEKIKDNYKYLVELYSRILEMHADQSKCIQRYQARSYVELGSMAYDVRKKKLSFPHGMAHFFPEKSPHMLQTREYFSKALEIFLNDVFVLERSGRYFRYIKEFQLSIDHLKRAISIKETSFGHHHLALSYIRLLEFDPQKDLECQFRYMAIDEQSTVCSGKGHIGKGSVVESVASCNQDSIVHKQIEFQFDNASTFPERDKHNTKRHSTLYYPWQQYCNKYQESRNAGSKKGLQTGFQSYSAADDSSNYCQRRKPNVDERKDKPEVKCPYDPVMINYEENKKVIENIFLHLNRASELSTNIPASYDKAILYRRIKQPDKALDILEHLMQQPRDLTSPIMLANIYEQAAFCKSAILGETNTEDYEKIEQLKYDRDMYLKSSLEMSCGVVAKIPHLHRCWKSASTLKEILLDRSRNKRSKETLRDLCFLYDKLNSHFEAIDVLKELKDLSDDDEQPKIVEDLVRRYMQVCNYEDAVIALRMTKQLQNSFPTQNQELYFQVHIEAGLDAFKKKHFEKARSRIRQALDCRSDARLDEMMLGEEGFELFVLSNLDCDDAGRKLTTLLTELGVKTTFNIDSHSVLPGTPELQGITEMMLKSEAFAILLDFDTEDKRMQHITERLQNIKQNRKDDPLTVVLIAPGTELSPASIYSVYDAIHINVALLSDSESMLRDDKMSKSIKELLLYVAKRHCTSYGKHA